MEQKQISGKIFLYVNQLFSSFCIHLNLQKINRYILQVSICSGI